MNFLKKLLVLVAFSAAAFSASSATIITHNINQAWPGTNLFGRGAVLYSVTVQNTNANANTWSLFDSSSATVSSSLTYTNTTYTIGNLTNVITTVYGVSQTNVYSNVITTTNQTLSSVTVARAKLATATIATGVTTTYTFTDPLLFTQGITITNGSSSGTGGIGPVTLSFDPNF